MHVWYCTLQYSTVEFLSYDMKAEFMEGTVVYCTSKVHSVDFSTILEYLGTHKVVFRNAIACSVPWTMVQYDTAQHSPPALQTLVYKH